MSNRRNRPSRAKADGQQSKDTDKLNNAAATGAGSPEAGATSTVQPEPNTGQAAAQQAGETSKANDAAAAGAASPETVAASTAQPEPNTAQAGAQLTSDAGAVSDTEKEAAAKKGRGPIAKQRVLYKGKVYGPGEDAGSELPAGIDDKTVASLRALDAIE